MRLFIPAFILAITAISATHAQDTVQVSAGWNIIGSVKAGAVPEVLSTDPPGIITTAFYGYAPGAGYQSADTLEKGLGYWVKVSADGIVVFNTTLDVSSYCGAKRVTHEGVTYHTVNIGDQCWLEENLNVGTMVTGATEQTDNAVIEKYCYADSSLYCGLYGGLYQWGEAMQYAATPAAQGICPPGWHVPTYADFQTLSSAVAGDANALKALGQGSGAGTGTDASGFAALLAGFRNSSGLTGLLGDYGFYWSSTEDTPTNAFYLMLDQTSSGITLTSLAPKVYGHSVRCVED